MVNYSICKDTLEKGLRRREFRAKIGARRNKNEVIQVSFKIHYWKEQEYAHAGGNVKENWCLKTLPKTQCKKT